MAFQQNVNPSLTNDPVTTASVMTPFTRLRRYSPSQQMAIKFTLLAVVVLCLSSTVLAIPEDDSCPPADQIVYSPFTPWFAFPENIRVGSCWHQAHCIFEEADGSRNQQFSATALVMGVLPLTLKDIAWPERRIAPVSRRPGTIVEILVRSLGLEPVVTENSRMLAARASPIARWAWSLSRKTVVLLVLLNIGALWCTYGALAVMEVYSKRSSLGCPYPIFILTWYIIALLPAALHTLLSRVRTQRDETAVLTSTANDAAAGKLADNGVGPSREGREKTEIPQASAIQGSDEWWPVQLVWAIYYIAGTLVFTSIMAVTVIELFVWVVIAFAATAASKLLAFFICLALEDIPW